MVFLIVGFNYFIGMYYGIVNLFYTTLLCISLYAILRYIRRIKYLPVRDLDNIPQIPSVSILIPVYNEAKVVVRAVNSALSVNYPFYDVIVINDGSDDGTLKTLIDTYKLRKIDLVYREILKTTQIRGFYFNSAIPNLLVIDKDKGGKADALNCGINACRNPYFCTVDADSILEKDALLRLIAPILEGTEPVIACGGVVRILNGTTLTDGTVQNIDLPEKNSVLFQIVEYLRAFLFGRVGWDAMNGIMVLSGTFSMFHKASVIDIGGYSIKHVSEDMEIIVRLHKHHIQKQKPYKIKFISDPICWTEVPETLKMLGRQRRRWHLGLIQTLVQHRDMLFRKKYGKLGMLVFPYYLFIEMLGPMIEISSYFVVVSSYFAGLVSVKFLLLFLTLAIFYGVFLSTASIFLEEITYRRYPRWSHLFILLIYGVLENFGYRQLNSFWRVQAIIYFLFGRNKWEPVEDKGMAVVKVKDRKTREKGIMHYG